MLIKVPSPAIVLPFVILGGSFADHNGDQASILVTFLKIEDIKI